MHNKWNFTQTDEFDRVCYKTTNQIFNPIPEHNLHNAYSGKIDQNKTKYMEEGKIGQESQYYVPENRINNYREEFKFPQSILLNSNNNFTSNERQPPKFQSHTASLIKNTGNQNNKNINHQLTSNDADFFCPPNSFSLKSLRKLNVLENKSDIPTTCEARVAQRFDYGFSQEISNKKWNKNKNKKANKKFQFNTTHLPYISSQESQEVSELNDFFEDDEPSSHLDETSLNISNIEMGKDGVVFPKVGEKLIEEITGAVYCTPIDFNNLEYYDIVIKGIKHAGSCKIYSFSFLNTDETLHLMSVTPQISNLYLKLDSIYRVTLLQAGKFYVGRIYICCSALEN